MATIHIHITDDLKERLVAQANREDRTMKAVIVRALERYIASGQDKDTCAYSCTDTSRSS